MLRNLFLHSEDVGIINFPESPKEKLINDLVPYFQSCFPGKKRKKLNLKKFALVALFLGFLHILFAFLQWLWNLFLNFLKWIWDLIQSFLNEISKISFIFPFNPPSLTSLNSLNKSNNLRFSLIQEELTKKQKQLVISLSLVLFGGTILASNSPKYISNEIQKFIKNRTLEFAYFSPQIKNKLNEQTPKWQEKLDRRTLEKSYDENKFNTGFVLEQLRDKSKEEKQAEVVLKGNEILKNESSTSLIESATQLDKFITEKSKELNTIDTNYRALSPEYTRSPSIEEIKSDLQKSVVSFISSLADKVSTKLNQQTETYIQNLETHLNEEIKQINDEIDKMPDHFKKHASQFANLQKGLKDLETEVQKDLTQLKIEIQTKKIKQIQSLKQNLRTEINQKTDNLKRINNLSTLVDEMKNLSSSMNQKAIELEEEQIDGLSETAIQAHEKVSREISNKIMDRSLKNSKEEMLNNVKNATNLNHEQKEAINKVIQGTYSFEDLDSIQQTAQKLIEKYKKRDIQFENPVYKWCNDNPGWLTAIKHVATLSFCSTWTGLDNLKVYMKGKPVDWENLLFTLEIVSTVALLPLGGGLAAGAGKVALASAGKMALSTTLKAGAKRLLTSGLKRMAIKRIALKSMASSLGAKAIALKGRASAVAMKNAITRGGQVALNQTAKAFMTGGMIAGVTGTVSLGNNANMQSLFREKASLSKEDEENTKKIYSI